MNRTGKVNIHVPSWFDESLSLSSMLTTPSAPSTSVANSSDPSFFSVQLLNSNNSQLNGNFQIGNALLTTNGSAQIFIDQIPAGNYKLLFVNSSNYQLDHPQVYYTSDSFDVKPNGTQPAQVTANTDANPTNSATTAATGSASATLSSVSSTGTGSRGNSNGASAMGNAGVVALCGSIASVVLGLGVGLVL
ncbi:hesp-379 protein [Pseudozyma hubeiensis SY62]|uniref:Hesp-379 protein n=1 Tax=Pseudozyma hubeiensis (strain SY62) TaxID=1305764 RepID=R9P5C0_PSEHS|nr:hesp-379 protein [Pseudozyma hubeiensis SY62]GAC96417.1 hesp-379 protein [Pseudozyma hubeiensis SY62]